MTTIYPTFDPAPTRVGSMQQDDTLSRLFTAWEALWRCEMDPELRAAGDVIEGRLASAVATSATDLAVQINMFEILTEGYVGIDDRGEALFASIQAGLMAMRAHALED